MKVKFSDLYYSYRGIYNISEITSLIVKDACWQEDQINTLKAKCGIYEEFIGKTLETLIDRGILDIKDISCILATKLEEVS